MANAGVSDDRESLAGVQNFSGLKRPLVLGFTYWCAFDLVLGSGRIAHALRTGAPIAWDQEFIRIAGAGLLGALATPPVLAAARRLPIQGPARWRHLALYLAISASVSTVMIAASCVLAPWLLVSEHRPVWEAIRNDMYNNVLLLAFCMTGLMALAGKAQPGRSPANAAGAPPTTPTAAPAAKRIAVKTRMGLLMIEALSIDWIETQGNYLVLHVGAQRHLIRDTSKRFEAMLDPEHFVRAHRQTIVAVDRISELIPLGSGDAVIRLVTGLELRVSRGYRDRVEARLRETAASEPIAPWRTAGDNRG